MWRLLPCWELQVLYNLFEWARMRYARVVVVGIANTMDLPERLTPKVRAALQRAPLGTSTRQYSYCALYFVLCVLCFVFHVFLMFPLPLLHLSC